MNLHRSHVGLVAASVVLIATSIWLLDALARAQFTRHLRDQAAQALALAANGGTPYRWKFNKREDLVAERVFGADDYDFDAEGVHVQSKGSPFEIGLRLRRPAPLREFGRLRITAHATASAQMQIIVREELTSPERVSAPFGLPDTTIAPIQLDKLAWTEASQAGVPLPPTAAMLRLHVALPSGAVLTLSGAELDRSTDAAPLDLSGPVDVVDAPRPSANGRLVLNRLDENIQSAKVQIAAISNRRDSRMPPLLLLPQSGRVEQQIALCAAAYATLPDAIVIPQDMLAQTFALARAQASAGPDPKTHPGMRWNLVALYAVILLYARLWPPRAMRMRAFVEVVLTLAGPLWLILGGYFDGNLHKPQLIVIAFTLAYAVSLSMPRAWRWNGSARAWLFALAVAAVAALIGVALHRAGSGINPLAGKQVLRYFGWALLQQYLLCAVCTERWRIVSGHALPAAYLGALGFALLHTPNAALMVATLFGGLAWCALYLRERALLPLACSHALSALLLLALVPRDVLHSAEVSARYFF